uniref:RING-type E3 ubiquitin transferase n=1 Tax=Ciona intestinalis TaxID=7719 RepID=A0A1W2W027_CIOIN|nr:E3 ubiquitin-protein ligase MARCH6 [Ciona intestinalis]|eukprot:XP_026696398.1 E3 ubiquitin-protein ligase MARCH6 [Ciona intestinalis]
MDDDEDICRVCRSTAFPDRPLFHPCICTGSIRHIHQDCLLQWLRHSRKEYCELCKHKYTFKPIYSPDMPNRLPVRDLLKGFARSITSAVKCWVHYTLVAIAWLGVVPLTASRIYNCIFAGSVKVLLSLPMDMLSTKNITADILHGCVVVACTVSAFVCLVWLRVQIMNGDMPQWLMQRQEEVEVIEPQPHNNDREQEVNEPEANDGEVIVNNNNVDEVNVPNPEIIHEEPIADEVQENNDADNINWDAINWDRAADEPTWERFLGLDGSLLFLEHVFWVVALNTLFILVFAFCPYHLGHFILLSVDLNTYVVATRFEGVLTTLCGYVIVAAGFLLAHAALQITKLQWPGRVFGFCYIILKVGLLVLVEIGAFPLVCGLWLDICTLDLFDATISIRRDGYLASPGTCIFVHWLVGMVFVFYFATFLMLLREVLRPGALWFLRNLNDPDFNPIHEMIHLPIYRHCRRFLLSVIIFGITIVIIAWFPVKLIGYCIPNFLPYNGSAQYTSPVGEFPLQLLVLQFVLPGLLEQGHTRIWLKGTIKLWSKVVGGMLGVKSYLLGDDEQRVILVPDDNNNNEPAENAGIPPLHAQHGVANEWNMTQPYTAPNMFTARLILLLCSVSISLTLVSAMVLYVPVTVGRFVFNRLFGVHGIITATGDKDMVMHELYTVAIGLYMCWLAVRVCFLLSTWAPRQWSAVRSKVVDVISTGVKAIILSVFICGLIPLMMGVLFDLVVIIPLRVPAHQTPVIFLWQDWALGVLLFKLVTACLIFGPDNTIKTAIEEAYNQGLQRMSLKTTLTDTVFPVIKTLALCLTIPYVTGHIIPVIFSTNETLTAFFYWRTYPLMISCASFICFCIFEIKQFQRLCDRIKNERYLIGKRLIDYEPAERRT